MMSSTDESDPSRIKTTRTADSPGGNKDDDLGQGGEVDQHYG